MKIILHDSFKSLEPFESEELYDLTIITGKNGSGKSQLLDVLGRKSVREQKVLALRFEVTPQITDIQMEGFLSGIGGDISYKDWRDILDRQVSSFNSLNQESKRLIDFVLENNIPMANDPGTSGKLRSDDPIYKSLVARIHANLYSKQGYNPNQLQKYEENKVFEKLFNANDRPSFIGILKELIALTGKSAITLTPNDFLNTPLKEEFIDRNDLFSSRIDLIFYNYAKRRDANNRSYFDKEKYGDQNDAVPDTEFTAKFPPPWKTINEILETHGIEFYFEEINRAKFDVGSHVQINLIKKAISRPIKFMDLSSGEQIIIGLIVKLFTSEYYNKTLTFPELLILDEPDAALHPEMSKLLIDVLHETFVKRFGIKVIFTTHSPSTVALTPEESIYELKNHNPTTLKKVTKDHALQVLTSFIPTLSIDYKNHRQVFVESPTDINYYQTLYDKHSQFKSLDHKLYFISNAMGKANCDVVYSIVDQIRKTGNNTCFGIVDWDTKNKGNDFVYVHGDKERYSIENFILDPIYLIIVLLELGNAHGIAELTGLSLNDNQYLIGDKSDDELQRLSDIIFQKFEKIHPNYKATDNLTEINYLNGKVSKAPHWFLVEQGHNIVTKLKQVFPALGKYPNEGELQSELITIMAKCYPFVPSSSIKLIETLADRSTAAIL